MGSLDNVPERLAPAFADKELSKAVLEARALLLQAPTPWEVVEVPEGGGFQPLDVPFKTVRKPLSKEDEEDGRRRVEAAYKRMKSALNKVDTRLKGLERGSPRQLLGLTGCFLVIAAVGIIVLGIFRHSEIQIVGKDGAAGLLLTTGVTLLTSGYKTDRNLRTLPARMQLRLEKCRAHGTYEDVLQCFSTALDEMQQVFGNIERNVPAK